MGDEDEYETPAELEAETGNTRIGRTGDTPEDIANDDDHVIGDSADTPSDVAAYQPTRTVGSGGTVNSIVESHEPLGSDEPTPAAIEEQRTETVVGTAHDTPADLAQD